jgi:molybdopterin-guanine dinucleotide biosynthesis protein A
VSVVAIVLAGGGSTRFGADKLSADLRGRPLLHHALEGVAGAADRMVVVLAPDAPDPPLPAAFRDRIDVVRDEALHRGPLAAVTTALAALPDDTVVVVVGGDMPRLVPAVLGLLAERVATGTGPAAVRLEGDPVPTLPVALRAAVALPVARDLLAADRRSLHALLEALRAETIPASEWRALDPEGATLMDVDTRADLARDAKTPVPGRKDGRSA